MEWNPDDSTPLPKPDPPASPGYGPSLHPIEPELETIETSLRSTSSGGTGSRSMMPRLTGVLCLLILALLLTTVLPSFVEQITYSIRRGELRAQFDHAGEALQQVALEDLSQAYQLIPQRVVPSVVSIRTTRSSSLAAHSEFSHFLGQPSVPEQSGQGSGVILDTEGYVLTNFHVVQDATHIEVHLSDGRTVSGDNVIGVDPLTDLAVIKIDADNLMPAEWGDSDALEPGSLVWALGSPFGLERSVSSGIVSATNRGHFTHQPYQDFLQTDVAVNPGNSGGPLVDVHGRVVGINTAIVGDSYQGVSFAIPSSIAQSIYNDLVENRSVRRGWLGVQLASVSKEDARETGLDPARGALIVSLLGDRNQPSPARLAGILPGDVILRWNDFEIQEPDDLSRQVALTPPGETATALIWREGEEIDFKITVAERSKHFQ